MSNLGIKKIKVPSNIQLTLNNNTLIITSNFGQLHYDIDPRFTLKITDNNIFFFPKKEKLAKNINCIWGTKYSLLKNYLEGLSRGYTKTLDLVGVGFKTQIENNNLFLKLGYSHEITYKIPSDVIIQCPKPDKIVIFGVNKQKVNEIVSKIQSLKNIDPYKGKGILLENTKLRLKEGKKK
jgi:large subunit ribosomal protein L6